MILHKVSLEEFNVVAEKAHLICFNEVRPADHNTFDFALFIEDEEHVPLAYATCIEMEKKSVYMQHGGAFPHKNIDEAASLKDLTVRVKSYHMMIRFLKEKYAQATTKIKGSNIAMLKLAFSAGFVPVGADIVEDGFFIHLRANFGAPNV